MGSNIQPYQIAIPDSSLETLQAKLSLATFPGQTDFSNDWKYGVALDDIKRIVNYWQEKHDWRKAEAELNTIPQYTTAISIDGHEDHLKIHFVHQKGEKSNSVPLLFCHGCEYFASEYHSSG
jgi:hypothetical protein